MVKWRYKLEFQGKTLRETINNGGEDLESCKATLQAPVGYHLHIQVLDYPHYNHHLTKHLLVYFHLDCPTLQCNTPDFHSRFQSSGIMENDKAKLIDWVKNQKGV